MAEHGRFNYKTLEDLQGDISRLGLDIPIDECLDSLANPVKLGRIIAPNALGVQPMEGCDGTLDGSPDELTFRRYERFARGGAGLLWFEACAVVPDGRANPRQLHIHEGNLKSFELLLERALAAAKETYGADYKPVCILQLTHSGRYSKPNPVLATRDPYLDPTRNIPDDYRIVDDDYLKRLEEAYEKAAGLAYKVGFDGVDIKACHRYLMSELLSARTREGFYGGDYEGRTRLLLNVTERVQGAYGSQMLVATRLNVYDGHPYPYGWGVNRDDHRIPDLAEPKRLVMSLRDRGVRLINVTVGNPYYTPHINRPYDQGPYVPPEHPLEGVARIIGITGEIQKTVPEVAVVASGLTWLRQFGGNVAAGMLNSGQAKIGGFGRQAFAYPNFAHDLMSNGCMNASKVCIACGRCTVIMRDGGRTGCVIRDSEVYGPIFKEGRKGRPVVDTKMQVAEHL